MLTAQSPAEVETEENCYDCHQYIGIPGGLCYECARKRGLVY